MGQADLFYQVKNYRCLKSRSIVKVVNYLGGYIQRGICLNTWRGNSSLT